MSTTLPLWDRLVPGRRRPSVEPPRRLRWPLGDIVDGDLPGADGATVFDAWPTGDGYRLWAAGAAGDRIVTFDVVAERLRLRRPDPALLRLLEIDPDAPPSAVELLEAARLDPVEPGLVCSCRGVGDDAVVRAIGSGWWTADAVKRRTRIAFGECQGRRCLGPLAERLELSPADPLARVTPRPPLVPVPASVLAAFAETRP